MRILNNKIKPNLYYKHSCLTVRNITKATDFNKTLYKVNNKKVAYI